MTELKSLQSRVVHCKRNPFDVYIGRGSKWGNPFKIGIDGNRFDVINKYLFYILNKPDLLYALHELEGKVLGCWCAPKFCHGHILIALPPTCAWCGGFHKGGPEYCQN
jgi:hypothetical protein